MGAFTDGDSPDKIAAGDKETQVNADGYETDVPDVRADGLRNDIPVFKVSRPEFYQNMTFGRKRLRFTSGTTVQKYMKGTRYNRPFFISYVDDKDGKEYVRKIK